MCTCDSLAFYIAEAFVEAFYMNCEREIQVVCGGLNIHIAYNALHTHEV